MKNNTFVIKSKTWIIGRKHNDRRIANKKSCMLACVFFRVEFTEVVFSNVRYDLEKRVSVVICIMTKT